MKHLTIFVTAASLLFVPFASADDKHHPEKGQKAAPATAAKPAEAKPAKQPDQPMMALQERMQKMRDIMDKMQKTTDPRERQKLLDEHMQAMGEGMKMMGGMGGGMMMGMMGNRDGMQDREKGGPENCPMMDKHGMMGKRMDMMQMMMEQMMEHQKAAEGMAK